jgi:hypothetical protein
VHNSDVAAQRFDENDRSLVNGVKGLGRGWKGRSEWVNSKVIKGVLNYIHFYKGIEVQ